MGTTDRAELKALIQAAYDDLNFIVIEDTGESDRMTLRFRKVG
jgi:predicted methyltransferase